MSQRKYSVVSSKKGTGYILEDDVRIAKYNFEAWCNPVFKFNTGPSEIRFDAFCGASTRAETVEALGAII